MSNFPKPDKVISNLQAALNSLKNTTNLEGNLTDVVGAIHSGSYSVSGGGLTPAAGSAAATSTWIDLGTATTTTPSGKYITVTGSGEVSMTSVITTHIAGYIPDGEDVSIESTTLRSNVATVYYPISSSVVDTESGTATAGDILSDKKAWVNGEEVTGSIPTKSSSDLAVSGNTVTVPVGYYAVTAEKSIEEGSAETPATTITANPTLSNTYEDGKGYQMSVSAEQSVVPEVAEGYISEGTEGIITVSGSTYIQQSTMGEAATSTATTATGSVGYGQEIVIGAGYHHEDRIIRNGLSEATKGETTIGLSGTTDNTQIVVSATNIYPTGYVTEETVSATNKTISLAVSTTNGAIIEAKDVEGTTVLATCSVTTVTMAKPSITLATQEGIISVTAANNQKTGYAIKPTDPPAETATISAEIETSPQYSEGSEEKEECYTITSTTTVSTIGSDGSETTQIISATTTMATVNITVVGSQYTGEPKENIEVPLGINITSNAGYTTALSKNTVIDLKDIEGNLEPEYIKEGVSIFGVEGTYKFPFCTITVEHQHVSAVAEIKYDAGKDELSTIGALPRTKAYIYAKEGSTFYTTVSSNYQIDPEKSTYSGMEYNQEEKAWKLLEDEAYLSLKIGS